jgi:trehalose-phosphatase
VADFVKTEQRGFNVKSLGEKLMRQPRRDIVRIWVAGQRHKNLFPLVPLYLGDDVTDEDAFQVVNSRGGLSILVADPPRRTAARYYLRNPEEVFRFLTRLLSLRQQCKQTNRPAPSV